MLRSLTINVSAAEVEAGMLTILHLSEINKVLLSALKLILFFALIFDAVFRKGRVVLDCFKVPNTNILSLLEVHSIF